MSGQRRLFRAGNRAPSILASKLNFGLIALLLLLAALAVVVTLKFPGTQLQFIAGP
jgi:hypothetical protein